MGRDAKGEWAIRPDGTVERERPRAYWPPWSVDGESLTVDSLDTLLEQLPKRYTLTRGASGPIDGGARKFDRVTASRLDRAGPYPNSVELWIDPDTHLAERVEFRWDDASGTVDGTKSEKGAPAPRGGGPRGEGGGEHGPGDGPDGHRPPPPPDGDGHGDGPGREPPPREGGERGGAGRGGLKLISILRRVEAPAFADEWFTPEGHGGK